MPVKAIKVVSAPARKRKIKKLITVLDRVLPPLGFRHTIHSHKKGATRKEVCKKERNPSL